jgi:hypothetical protein
MEHYVGLDVSLKQTAICIVDRTGRVRREGIGLLDRAHSALWSQVRAFAAFRRVGFCELDPHGEQVS